jgi:hypothetical protein
MNSGGMTSTAERDIIDRFMTSKDHETAAAEKVFV